MKNLNIATITNMFTNGTKGQKVSDIVMSGQFRNLSMFLLMNLQSGQLQCWFLNVYVGRVFNSMTRTAISRYPENGTSGAVMYLC